MLSEEVQSLVAAMLQMLKMITDMMSKIIPAINQLQTYLLSVDDLNLGASDEFSLVRAPHHWGGFLSDYTFEN